MKRCCRYTKENALLLLILLSLALFSSPVQAGGVDIAEPSADETIELSNGSVAICQPSQESGEQGNAGAKRKCKLRPRLLDWRYWQSMQIRDGDLCRDHQNGNVVCLSPVQAQRVHWLH